MAGEIIRVRTPALIPTAFRDIRVREKLIIEKALPEIPSQQSL